MCEKILENQIMKLELEKKELTEKIEAFAEDISSKFSRVFFAISIPIIIAITNYQILLNTHPAYFIQVIQLVISIILAFYSLLMALTKKGFINPFTKKFKLLILQYIYTRR